MLTRLQVNNYALIGNAEIRFPAGLTIITGETGAGKSILLGALSLILGSRADTSVLLGHEKKCVVEGEFDLSDLNDEGFFANNNLDFEKQTLIRREIGVDGKSRAFVNDTPVTLAQLKTLGAMLVDVHSQHETLSLNNASFQLAVLDALAGNQQILSRFKGLFNGYTSQLNTLQQLILKEEKSRSELDFFQFNFEELEKAGLKPGEQEQLEEELKTLDHAESIRSGLNSAVAAISGDEENISAHVLALASNLRNSSKIFSKLTDAANRLQSVYIELKDISAELESLEQGINADPRRLETINERLENLYSLLHKHRLKTVDELIIAKNELEQKINSIQSLSNEIGRLEAETSLMRSTLLNMAITLNENRKKAAPKAEKEMLKMLSALGMPGATFRISISETVELHANGKDAVVFLFSANKGFEAQELAKVASGGELSRLMLCIKSLVAKKISLPTMVLDEIDSGISGETAFRVGEMLQQLSGSHQMICITHLPQIAAKGNTHHLVYKYMESKKTKTGIRTLAPEERVREIAQMIGGESPSDTALENAKELLQQE